MGPSPPNYLHNRTCKKFKSGEIFIVGNVRQVVVHSCVIISIIICVCVSIIAKIRFQLSKLVQKLVPEGEKLGFLALEIQNFPGGASLRTTLGGSLLCHSMFAPLPPQHSPLATFLHVYS